MFLHRGRVIMIWASGRRKLFWAASVFLSTGLGLLAVSWYGSEMVLHPEEKPSPYQLAEFDHLSLENVYFESRDGLNLAGWFVPGTNGATVILAHGRNSERSWMLPHAHYLSKDGFSVLMFDLRYSGESEGKEQTLGAKEAWDIGAALDYLKDRSDVDPEKIGVQGISLGAASAILATAERPEIRGVVAEIPFKSVNGVMVHTYPRLVGLPSFPFAGITKWICEFRLGVDLDAVAPDQVIGTISPRPVFLIDDGLDDLFPPDSVEVLFEAAQQPKQVWQVSGASHARGRETAPEEYERRVLAFWRETFGLAEPSTSDD